MNVFRDPKLDFTQKRYEFEADNGKQAGTSHRYIRIKLTISGDCLDYQGSVSICLCL